MNKIKKLFPVLLSLAMLTACTADEETAETTTAAATEAATTTEAVTTTEAAPEEVLPECTIRPLILKMK